MYGNGGRKEIFDRIDELARLNRFLDLEEGALACLYGRRRTGKSRLLEELLGKRFSITGSARRLSRAGLGVRRVVYFGTHFRIMCHRLLLIA